MPWMQHKPGNGIIYAADGEIQGNFIYGRGVPQGGILSPWLFNLVIDELLNSLEINQFSVDILAFADDICVGGSSAVKIQETVNFIEEWLESSGMELAKNKCEYLYFGKEHATISVGNYPLKSVEGLTYLGLNFTSKMIYTKDVGEEEYLKAIYAKYSGTSPLQTAKIIRAVRWSKILYGTKNRIICFRAKKI
eukprot:GHVP01032533.1.p1 GENE.GHVP01032533.1~~GHVP01032533.1.p1  ORF type:complete len:193 (+),score=25.67 GHVP01032533.1:274-852(+)